MWVGIRFRFRLGGWMDSCDDISTGISLMNPEVLVQIPDAELFEKINRYPPAMTVKYLLNMAQSK